MNVKHGATQERILVAALDLFSKQGYNGTSTRDIANLADVNEVTIYRHYASKRALFVAVVESELSKISFGTDAIGGMVNASDARSAMWGLFGLISDVATRHPEMIRLLQFAALELGADLEPICRKHLGNLLNLSVGYLSRWVDVEGSPCSDPRILILAFVSTVVGVNSLFPVLWGEQAPLPKSSEISACANIWNSALSARVSV